MALNEVADGLWRCETPGAGLRQPGGVYLPLASAVVRLPDRSLAIYGPIGFDDAQAAAIEACGEVAHVLAPNLLHTKFVAGAVARWPRATLHAPAALGDRFGRARPLADPIDAALRDALDLVAIAGAPKLGETVALHRASGTLLCADFVFHITRPANLRTRLVLAMTGTGGGRLAQSRIWRFAVKDRAAAPAAVERVLAWPIARVAPAHGEPIAIDAAGLGARLRIRRTVPAR